MALLRRKSTDAPATLDDDALTDESLRAGGKGRPTPKRADARTGRSITYKTPSDPKAARRSSSLERRSQASQYRVAMRAGDLSKMPPRERTPERVLARDIVDGRRNIGPIFLVLALLYFISPISHSFAVVVTAQLLMFIGLVAVIADSVLVGRKVSKAIVEQGLDPNVKVRAYAAQRGLLPRRWRMPRARVAPKPAPWSR
jgi:hypothetical protein